MTQLKINKKINDIKEAQKKHSDEIRHHKKQRADKFLQNLMHEDDNRLVNLI